MSFRQFPKFLPFIRAFIWPFIGLMLLGPVPASAWGPEGHEIVALIALKELTPNARAQVARLLGSPEMMVHDSSWADEIRDRRPETARWHYVDIPLGASGYDARRDCPRQDCVVAQIENDFHVLGDSRLNDGVRAEALRFLIHFVADVHQPLHAENNDDKGGNQVRIYLGRERTTLHRLWDGDVVEALGVDAGVIADGILRGVSPNQRKAWAAGTPAGWADESHAWARDQIYPPLMGRHELRLPRDYPRGEAAIARRQLAKAGVRLAWLLNMVLR
ncbi:MAG TPA: S1/P1 nuclease [Rhizomicrobium sp.]|nr:S1/P1 nuclease [Rhizomicrobium sp.]